jgi:Zn-dependent protease
MEKFILNLAMGLPGFLVAVIFHEAAHAAMANFFGDDTAKREGRLSLNPLVHLDVMGTVIFPMIGAMLGGFMFGWAKPVPVNPSRFKNVRWGIFWVSFAGPGINLIMGSLFAVFLGFFVHVASPSFYFFDPILQIVRQAVYINFILAAFNLIPFPPLDGSKMVSSFLSYEALRKYEGLAAYSFLFFIVLMFTNIISYLLMPAIFMANFLLLSSERLAMWLIG